MLRAHGNGGKTKPKRHAMHMLHPGSILGAPRSAVQGMGRSGDTRRGAIEARCLGPL